jgi:hypothetical protein
MTATKASTPTSGAKEGDAMRRGAPLEQVRGESKGGEAAGGPDRGQARRLRDAQAQDLAAVGLEQDLLHGEAGGSEPQHHQQTRRAAAADEALPGLHEARLRRIGGLVGHRLLGAVHVHGLLLPERDHVEGDGHQGDALQDPDQSPVRLPRRHAVEVRQQTP